MLVMGMADLTPGVEEETFNISGARVRKQKRQCSPMQTLDDLLQVYQHELLVGSKEERNVPWQVKGSAPSTGGA